MKKVTLSIGIPAHNEEKNILFLLRSILAQSHENYILEKIYVVCDGCTDHTAQIVDRLAKDTKEIMLLNDHKRKGKAHRLNEIYKMCTSDLILTIDADVVCENESTIDTMVSKLISSDKLLVVVPRFIPVEPTNIWAQFSAFSFRIYEDAFLQINDGNNIHSLIGAAVLMKKRFYEFFRFPNGVTADQMYLYLTLEHEYPHSYCLEIRSAIYFRTVSSFKDWRVLGKRSVITDKQNSAQYFGEKFLNNNYRIPKFVFFKSLVKYFVINPIYTSGALLLNIYVRLFPYPDSKIQSGIWEIVNSTKDEIIIKL